MIGSLLVAMTLEQDNNGGLMEVWSHDRYSYRRRLVVDKEGESNPVWADKPLLPQLKAKQQTPSE